MGRYVWRKSEIVQPQISVVNPTVVFKSSIDYSVSSAFRITFTSNNSEVDFTKMSYAKINLFLNGFAVNSNRYIDANEYSIKLMDYGYSRFIASSESQLISKQKSIVTYENDSWTAGSSTYSMTYSGTKTVQDLVTNPVTFVVGNSPDQFPSNGQKGDYWYELIGSITSANALSLSSLSADTMRDISVEEIKKGVTNGLL